MASQPPIPIPAAFDELDLAGQRAYLRALRDRIEQTLEVDEGTIEDAVFEEIERRRAGVAAGTRRTLSRDELMGPLRAKYG